MSIKIGLDAGHGINTAGKQTPNGIKEWNINDAVRDKVVSLLSAYDCEFVHTDNNEGATDESLTSRLNKYINAGVSAFVSIHHNAYTGSWNGATGVEVYTDKNPTSADEKLADCIYGRLVNNTGLKGRGIKRANFTVINQNKIPAVLVEGGFMDGTTDYAVITSEAGQNAYAQAVAEGLIEFLGLKKKVVVTTTPTPEISQPPETDLTLIAKEVIAGKWGNGEERKARLKAAGYSYSTVQAKVNELCGNTSVPKSSVPAKKTNEHLAREVIAGKWGNGEERKKKLTEAGYNYTAIQKAVNRLL